MSLDDFEQPWKGKSKAPKGWEPSLDWRGDKGTITTTALDGEPTDAIWAELIKDWGLDPKSVSITPGSVQVRGWDANVGGGVIQRLKYYRATLEPLIKPEDRADIESLCREVMRRKPVAPKFATGSDRAVVVNLSDWQVGKRDVNGGTVEFVEAIHLTMDRLTTWLKSLRKVGIECVYLIGLGDLVEQCGGHYPSQAFKVDLDRREQMRLARRLILAFVERIIGLGLRCVLGAVPGNHGENRNGAGKKFTTNSDNDDLAVFDGVAEVLSGNPDRYALASVPQGAIADDLTLTLDVAGVPMSWAHGHQFGTGGAEKWWAGQALGRQPVASAQILNTGHFHHLVVSEKTSRTWVQMPAMDGGSEWWTDQTGQWSPRGTVAYVAGNSCGPRGWSDLVIL